MYVLSPLEDFCLNESETRRFPFELVYHLYFLEYNGITPSGENLYIDNRWSECLNYSDI